MSLETGHRKVLIDFFQTGTRLQYDKGDFIIRPGETPPGVFFIQSGLVKSYDITKYGEENLLVIRREGELLGMTAAITGYERHIIYTALAPTVAWLVSSEHFTKFLEATPEAALPLVAMVTDMYRVNAERILNLEYRTVRERLISFLLSMAGRFGVETPEGIMLDVPLRHQDIASSISATRETTGRELTSLERRGLLSNKSLYFTLRDIEALQRFL
jgi:CRP/FNR family transcriptional regulator, cyclic AMP receptor protein